METLKQQIRSILKSNQECIKEFTPGIPCEENGCVECITTQLHDKLLLDNIIMDKEKYKRISTMITKCAMGSYENTKKYIKSHNYAQKEMLDAVEFFLHMLVKEIDSMSNEIINEDKNI